jgi:hypothetical protein
MNPIPKSASITAVFALLAASAAFADDPQLQNRLAIERARNAKATANATTVAVYAKNRGLGRTEARTETTPSRFELRRDAHGQTFGSFVPANK